MTSVFSHVVQRRLSHETEDVATEALAFILRSSEAARHGFLKLLRGIQPELPDLYFRTQQTEDNVRPDMWGLDDSNTPHVFVESKFWAGLTENQPVEYLTRLARHAESSVLLVVAPEARQETVWAELERRLNKASISHSDREPSASVSRIAETDLGPALALTSWRQLLAAIEAQLADDPQRRHDLLQLRALCDAVDIEAFVPLSPEELTDQRAPALVLQMNAVVEGAVARGVASGILSTQGLTAAARWKRIGRYVSFPAAGGVGAWLGTHFRLWRDYGRTPLWLVFSSSDWGRAPEVRALLEPWAQREGVLSAVEGDEFVVGIDLVTGEEKDHVVEAIVALLRKIETQLLELADKGV
jgi:hypothetical protein